MNALTGAETKENNMPNAAKKAATTKRVAAKKAPAKKSEAAAKKTPAKQTEKTAAVGKTADDVVVGEVVDSRTDPQPSAVKRAADGRGGTVLETNEDRTLVLVEWVDDHSVEWVDARVLAS
jgi:hypothetical protein